MGHYRRQWLRDDDDGGDVDVPVVGMLMVALVVVLVALVEVLVAPVEVLVALVVVLDALVVVLVVVRSGGIPSGFDGNLL